MKQKITAILLFISGITVLGQEASGDLLVSTAEKFISKIFPAVVKHEINSVRPILSDSVRTMYIVDLIPEGWILMSADQRVQPVLAFSLTGNYIIAEKNPENNQYLWINKYENEIKAIISDKGMTQNEGWKGIFDNSSTGKGTTEDIWVNSLIKVNWGQGNSWNQFCPPDATGPGGNTYVGCVAVSMAQAMSVFKKPTKGYGTNSYIAPGYGTQFVNFGVASYKWDSMSLSLPDRYNALFLYHCAVSVNMEFGADGSSTQPINASAALKNFFYYSRRTSYKKRFLIDQDWIDLLDQQLLLGRPVIYVGDADNGKPGHAFNIDGVANTTYFHINWGWSGSNNGYYTINSLRPGSNDFTKNQAAIFGIQPFYFPTDIVLSDTLVQTNIPEGYSVGVLTVIDEATNNVYSVKMISDSTFNGSCWVRDYFLDGDTVRTGRMFCVSDNPTDTILITVTDQFSNIINKKIALKVGSLSTGINNSIGEGVNYFNIYPNPSTDHIFFDQKKIMDIIELRIYSANGVLVQIHNIKALDEGIALNNLEPGLYILEVELTNHLLIRKKFIRR